MSRVRSAALHSVLALSLVGLAACGSGSSDSESSGGASLSSVTIDGDHGKEPKVTFDGPLDPSATETEVLIEGDGAEVADGETVSANWWIGNGFTEEEAQSTYTKEGTPQSVELTEDILPFLREAVIGNQVGDRVVLLTPAEDAFGEAGNPSIGIGNKDAVLAVVDILDTRETVPPLDGPQGEEKEPASWAPTLIEEDGVITGLDFTDAHTPTGELIATTLIKGDGAKVTSGQTLTVDYLGQVYNADAPFDESYSKEPAEFPIGVGQVIDGWDQRLVGRTVGSRVILEIPPAQGYGEQGNEQAGITGTDTLFFVVDILGAS